MEHSKNARDVTLAKANLISKVNDGQNVLGTVRSNNLNSRQDLFSALSDAQQIATTSTSADPNVYINQLNKLQKAIDKFNATAISE